MDAIQLLKRDHQEVTKLFQRFSAAKSERAGKPVVDEICAELEVHAQIEEEIFYPAVREADQELGEQVQEALQEHSSMKRQVDELKAQNGAGSGPGIASRVSELERCVEHHVSEEEGEMFPRVAEVIDARKRADLGQRLQARKQELKGGGRRPATGRKASRARRTRTATPRRATPGRRAKVAVRRTKTARSRGRAVKRTRRRARASR